MQIAIMLYPGFTALDFIGPYESLRYLPGAEVRFVWHQPGPIAADSAVLLVGATHSFDETPSPDVVLIPGGFSTVEHARDPKVLDWVRTAHRTSTWTVSVCSGSLILAAAGLLDGKRATSHWAALPVLRTFGAQPVNNERHRVRRRQDRHLRRGVGRHRPRTVAGGSHRRRGQGQGQGHPAVHGVRPATTVRLRPHVEGLGEYQGAGHRDDVRAAGQTRSAGGEHRPAVGRRSSANSACQAARAPLRLRPRWSFPAIHHP